ncbi:MAG: OsmC family protein [Bacteroidia bacterium]
MSEQHHYHATVKWTGNKGEGTTNYRSYEREHTISIENKTTIVGSADPAFRGDHTKHNPEELLISSLSACHMLWYLHLCSEAGVIVTDYSDKVTGLMIETLTGRGIFKSVTLNPVVVITDHTMVEKANGLHKKANELCFIANAVNFAVHHNPTTIVK